MTDALSLREIPEAEETVMLVGWRQWADAGAISSGLPKYLIERTNARRIGTINSDGFYLFQFPGTHDLVRPTVRFVDGYPQQLETPTNDIFYTTIDDKGIVILTGDEPHLDIERYIAAVLDAAEQLQVSSIIGFGGVYAEVPYNRERSVSCSFSKYSLKETLQQLSVNFSNYHGGASIGSVLCRRAGDRSMDYAGFYALVPNYDLSRFEPLENTIRIENDFMAWFGIMRRVSHMLTIGFDLSDLKDKTKRLITVLDDKIEELHDRAPTAGVRTYFDQLADSFGEEIFNPLDDVWEDELRRLLDDDDA